MHSIRCVLSSFSEFATDLKYACGKQCDDTFFYGLSQRNSCSLQANLCQKGQDYGLEKNLRQLYFSSIHHHVITAISHRKVVLVQSLKQSTRKEVAICVTMKLLEYLLCPWNSRSILQLLFLRIGLNCQLDIRSCCGDSRPHGAMIISATA